MWRWRAAASTATRRRDTQVPYLKTVFTFLGLTDVQFVYAEGLAMGPEAEQKALASAHEQIEEAVAA